MQPAAKSAKAPAKKEESSSEESDEDSDMEDVVGLIICCNWICISASA